ncbi:MAG: GatB/YqeY domain-containing protein [Tissierellia bacterium]|nr:GatB/YqeY domain-containing protein [Tissierellia bacterium]
MSFLDNLRKDKMKSMKEKDKIRTAVITNMMSTIALAEKEGKKTLTDDEALKFVQKELKQAKDTLEMLPESRTDAIEEIKERISIIESYLPEQLSEGELEDEIRKIISDEGIDLSPKSKGIIMKSVMAKFQGRTDGKTVNKVVDKILN